MRIVTTHTVDDDGLTALRTPRADVVVERASGPDTYEAAGGPFQHYERTLTIESPTDGGPGHHRVTETTDWKLGIWFWGFLFVGPMRRALRTRRTKPGQPWWAPPDVLDARAANVLGLLCTITLIAGYMNTVVTQTITFAADEFGADRTAQSTTLAIVRFGALVTFAAGALADRRGRRQLLIGAALLTSISSVAGAFAPSLAWLGASQVLSRGSAGAMALLIAIVSAEEMPAGSRAYAFSLITMATGLGAGMCVWALPLADLGEQGWRLLYVLPLLFVPLALAVRRRLPESRRFERPHPSVSSVAAKLSTHRRRFWLLAAMGLLLAIFAAPASQLQNDFLRDDRGFSAARISLFTLCTSTPAGLGIVIGGRIADVRGRRRLGAFGVLAGTGLTVVMFAIGGWGMWMASLVGAIAAGMAAPAIGVFRSELFPTSLRGRAAGVIEVISLTGSAIGLVVAGTLADRWGSYAGPMTLLAIGPLLVALLVAAKFPETAHQSLEDLNPEDRLGAGADPQPVPLQP